MMLICTGLGFIFYIKHRRELRTPKGFWILLNPSVSLRPDCLLVSVTQLLTIQLFYHHGFADEIL